MSEEDLSVWSVRLPYGRDVANVRSITVEAENCLMEFLDRRKDLEFEYDEDEFVFETKRVEYYS